MRFSHCLIKLSTLLLLCATFAGAQTLRSLSSSTLKAQGRAIFLALTEEHKKFEVGSDQWENRILIAQPNSSAHEAHKLGRAEFRNSYLGAAPRQQLFFKANAMRDECFRRLGRPVPKKPWFSVDQADSLGQRTSQLNDLLVQLK